VTAHIATPQDFARRFDVSRETMVRLETYAGLLAKWNRRINLVSPASLPDAWHRHFADSAQLLALAPPAGLWLDIGSGAGFPGLVVAILAPGLRVRLIESDQRKCAFLRRVTDDTGTRIDISPDRIEALRPQSADVISARALAPLTRLLVHAEKHLAPGGIGLFPKGRTVHNEIAEAERAWRFPCRIHPSLTESEAAIVETGAPARA
jgi:16S rRNA (guanine527-N7)-methyltransferase